MTCSSAAVNMVWFQCEGCGDSLKKPALKAHLLRCRSQAFSCIDCSERFDRVSVAGHTSCVTEHQKYALLATKPGGSGAGAAGPSAGQHAPTGTEFLASSPPWVCACCNVTCTSRAALEAHAVGKKHRSKARTALGTAASPDAGVAADAEPPVAAAEPPVITTTIRACFGNGSRVAAAEPPAAVEAAQPPVAAACARTESLPKRPRDGGESKLVRTKSLKTQATEAAAAPAPEGAAAAHAAERSPIKWKKLAEGVLRPRVSNEAGSMSLKKLRMACFAAARAKHGEELAAGSSADFERAITTSRRFAVADGRVSLVANGGDT